MSKIHSLWEFFSKPHILAWGFIIVLSYCTYFHNYQYPPNFFWDENYHVASAQKYLNGVHFMEPHPPLGKLFIALGEKILHPNTEHDQFVGTDYGQGTQQPESMAGYRLFPALLAWMIAPILFGIFLLLTKDHLLAIALSFLYIFDNAIIVHSRSSMLESTLLFFVLLMIFSFILIIQNKGNEKRFCLYSILFGIAFAATVTTKANGLIMILLIPALLWKLWPKKILFLEFLTIQSFAFLIVFVGIWQIHFALGSTINPSLPDAGYYKASDAYISILNDKENASLAHFPIMLRDSLKFFMHYEGGVPKLDLSKASENGSPWFLWPFGARTINYRWETPGTPAVYKYLYLQSNPVVWFFGITGIVLSISLLASSILLPIKTKLRHGDFLALFLGLYIAYMFGMSRIDRVMYLYHYFVPLLFSFILFGICLLEIQQIGRIKVSKTVRRYIALACALLIFAGYEYYRPLTYYEPITDEAFERRNLLQIWDLRCVRCKRDSAFVQKVQ